MKNKPVWEFSDSNVLGSNGYFRIKVDDIIVMLIDTDSDKVYFLDDYVISIDMIKHIAMHYDEAKNTGKVK